MAQVAACRSCIPLSNPEMKSWLRDSRFEILLHPALESRPGPEHRSNRSGSRTQSGRGTVSRQRHNERVMPPHLDAPFRAPRGAICDHGIFYSPSVSTVLRSRHGAVRFGGYYGGDRSQKDPARRISAFENALPVNVNCIAVHILQKELRGLIHARSTEPFRLRPAATPRHGTTTTHTASGGH